MNIEFAQKEIPPGMIFRLVELSAKDVVQAYDRLKHAKDEITIINHQNDGVFDWYAVMSGNRIYEVTRLGYFAFCTCKGFEFTQNGCKHIAKTLPPKCTVCFERESQVNGKCRDCYQLTEGFLNRPEPKAPAFVSTGTL